LTDCQDVMETLLRTQTNFEALEDEDPQISYMISSWARMCKILGKDFEKYLPVVMGPVLKTASFKPEIAVVDGKLINNLKNFIYLLKKLTIKQKTNIKKFQMKKIGNLLLLVIRYLQKKN
jgi:hypothetical protein